MSVKLEVKHLYKIFGDDPSEAFTLLDQGVAKDEIFSRTGLTVGVHDANLSINEGEIFVVMGLSGSGKSTLVRLLNRLIEPTRGQVLIDGEDIAAIDERALQEVRRRKIAMVFQSFALMPHMSVLDNTAFGLEIAGESVSVRHEKARNALKQVGLEAHANSYPDELSGGMQQRVGLARALANDPDILLMDEAFSALDPLIRTGMQDELVALQHQHKRTIVFISHDLDEAMRIGDRIAIMQGGVVVQVGTPDEILNNPANDYVRSFFRGVDVSNVFSAKDIAKRRQATIIRKESGNQLRSALQLLKDNDREYGYVVDRENRYIGAVSVTSMTEQLKNEGNLESSYLEEVPSLAAKQPVGELIGTVAQAPCSVPVVDEDGKYLGVISKAVLLETLDREGEGDE
ncbi:glycine betaine/L-proline ABC transporter ATP-binding protein ProV [Marinobacterium mangrovicola]|uniref:Quaternary amine transport ATP-binding protein n=1 Tax=Marinobacterium mangrovicola TaxID=1476959 RepID=A0A4V2PEF2_9GAMM|nr:glycine betaine/L-proline ABC transporter ATP-binding protein ProV [Marinobacterium mangrovicola]TCK08816.1 glycine betaine/proline transport system ATP-binding protein [Marinobacterium mangrovicola]